jgi:hypothetical protein
VRCVSFFDQIPHHATRPGPHNLRQLTRELGISILENTWHQITGVPLPEAVRTFVQIPDPTTNEAPPDDQ